ncbi:MAG: hypothetical protein NTY38_10630, partial [Acidobacteria bacterium]|nr:hypothetical protein [Acidobacteriota bacterium]
MRSSILALFLCLAAHAADPHWSASKSNGLSLVKGPGATYQMEKVGTETVATVTPVKDMYHRAN